MAYRITFVSIFQDNLLMAYQIAFDLYDSATQQFLQRVTNALRSTVPLPEPEKPASKTDDEKKERLVLTKFLLLSKCFFFTTM